MTDLFAPPPGYHVNRAGETVRTVRTNCFRHPITGNLDREYLRTCAIYRLLKHGRIDWQEAQIMADKFRRNYLTATLEIWKNGPLRHIM